MSKCSKVLLGTWLLLYGIVLIALGFAKVDYPWAALVLGVHAATAGICILVDI